MIKINRIAAAVLSSALIVSSLTGCTKASSKNEAKEAAENFLSAVQSGDENSINTYASGDVASGSFVKLFDVNSLKEQFLEGFGDNEVEEETSAKLDEFCNMFSSLITGYEVTEVTIDDEGVATALSTVETRFPIDVIGSDEASKQIDQISESYYTEHQDELVQLINDEGEEAATITIYNEMTRSILDVYEGLIEQSEPETYAIVLTLKKNAETDSWYVTNIQDYDSSINGVTTPATDTDVSTTNESVADETETETTETD